jgi:hypothetical protein
MSTVRLRAESYASACFQRASGKVVVVGLICVQVFLLPSHSQVSATGLPENTIPT